MRLYLSRYTYVYTYIYIYIYIYILMHRWCLELGADYLCCPPCLYLLCLSVLFLSPSLSPSLSPPSSFSLSLFLPLSFLLPLSSLSVLCVSVSPLPSLTHPPPPTSSPPSHPPSPSRPAPQDRLFPLPDPRSLLILSQNRSQGNEKTSIFLRFFNYLHQPWFEIC